MPARKGRCPNFGNCNIADSREVIVVPPGADDLCTACSAKLNLEALPPRDYRWMAIATVLILGLLGGVTWLVPKVKTAPFPTGQNSIGMRFAKIPSTGTYWSIWETRVSDFAAFIKENPEKTPTEMVSLAAGKDQDTGNFWRAIGRSWNQPEFEQSDKHPVVGVSFEDGQAFCDWLNEKERVELKKFHLKYRLPTEEEWKAAAAYNGTYPWGNDWTSLVKSGEPPGNYAGVELRGDPGWPAQFKTIAGYSDGRQRTAPVGTYAANRFGLFDMDGNVSEWCSTGTASVNNVACGGSWCSREPEELEATAREELPLNTRNSRIGFRVIAAPEK